MVRSILVGLDGSAYSEAAVELGLRWARASGGRLIGLGIVDEPTILRTEPVPLGATAFKKARDEALLSDARRAVERFLDEFRSRTSTSGVQCDVLRQIGLPPEEIVLEAQRHDLILLGKRTYYRFETEEGPDRTLVDVLRNSPRPVVTVPEGLGAAGPAVIAYDGSLQAARTLQVFQALRLDLPGEIHIVSIAANAAIASARAAKAAEYLGLHGREARVHTGAPAPSDAAGILEEARRLGAGLVVMGAYGKPILREFFFGSVTRTLLKESPLPLFLYH